MLSQPELYRGGDFRKTEVSPDKWIEAFGRLKGKPLVAFCNAETALYRGAARVIDSCERFETLVYTNASTWSLRELWKITPRKNLKLYVSYHRGEIFLDEFIHNALILKSKYRIQNFHAPAYPPFRAALEADREKMRAAGIKLNIDHAYLGVYEGKFYPSYLGTEGPEFLRRFLQKETRRVLCRVSFNHASTFSRAYTVAPDGSFYLCWRYLYSRDERGIIGSFFDPGFEFEDKYYPCDYFGDCHICAWHNDILDRETKERLDDDR